MSVAQILEELPRLSAVDLRAVERKLRALRPPAKPAPRPADASSASKAGFAEKAGPASIRLVREGDLLVLDGFPEGFSAVKALNRSRKARTRALEQHSGK